MKGNDVTDEAVLQKQKNNARLKVEVANKAMRESNDAHESAIEGAKKKQQDWNNAYEKVCLEVQREEELRYVDMVKVILKAISS